MISQNESQKILAKQFVNRFVGSGFQDTAVDFSIETGEFIQILHAGLIIG